MEFTCKCGKTSTKTLGYKITPDSKCGDCIDAEVKSDEPRRRAKIEKLVEDLKKDKMLTHEQARIATMTPGSLNLSREDIGSIYLSRILNKEVPFYMHYSVCRCIEDCVVESCLLNGFWPWARYDRDDGTFGYICLMFEP